jgi:hypothetical protein
MFGSGMYENIIDRVNRTQIATPDGRLVPLVPSKARKARIRFDPEGRSLEMTVKSGRKIERWYNDDARTAAALILPRANIAGAGKKDVQHAVELVAGSTSANDPLVGALGSRRVLSGRAVSLKTLNTPQRLALEMALHEEQERRALEGELKLLELRWKQAEEIAAIADSLTVPDSVEEQFARLKGATPK